MKIKYSDKLFENMSFYADVATSGLHIESDGASKDGWTLMEITGKKEDIDAVVKKYEGEVIGKPTDIELNDFKIK